MLKNKGRANANDWLRNVLIVDFGRVTKVIDMQTVVAETVVQTSLSREAYTVSLLNLSSGLLEISAEPVLGDTVLLLFLRKHHPRMFISETVNDSNATGYNRFSGAGILMSTVKKAAHTIVSCYDDDGKPVTDITSDAEVYGTFNNLMTLEFCRPAFDSEDERIINTVFGTGRPLVEKHLARTEREHGFWKDPENELVETDASVTERYSVYAPVTKEVQGAQTYKIGIGEDGDTDAPVTVTIGGNADIFLSSKSGMASRFDKSVRLESADTYDVAITGKITVSSDDAVEIVAGTGKKVKIHNAAQSLGQILSDFIQAVHDATTLGSSTAQWMNPATKAALQALKTRCEALMEK
jgi:hypothetical protein